MARTVQVIQNSITAIYIAAMAAIGITIDPTKWSRRNKQQLFINTFSIATAAFEQINDAYVAEIENNIASAYPQTPPWIQNLVLNIFQYNSTTPQVIQLSETTFAPYYVSPNTAYLLCTQCVVVPGTFGNTIVQAAKTVNGSYVALATNELSALQSTLNTVTLPGMKIVAKSLNADQIFIGGTVTYNGQYANIISGATGTVALAIQAYLSSIPASGVVGVGSVVGLMKLSDLIAAVRAVPGVIDFELTGVNARLATATFTPGSYNMVNQPAVPGPVVWALSEYNSGSQGAGYMVTETTTGYDIGSSLNFIAQ